MPRCQGPIIRAAFDVLKARFWGFRNVKSGKCFPGYQAIADKAGCHRDTVHEAIKALERADVLTWSHRVARIKLPDGRRQIIEDGRFPIQKRPDWPLPLRVLRIGPRPRRKRRVTVVIHSAA